jgi:hypothetical protein
VFFFPFKVPVRAQIRYFGDDLQMASTELKPDIQNINIYQKLKMQIFIALPSNFMAW